MHVTSKKGWKAYRNTWSQVHDRVEEAMAKAGETPITVVLSSKVPRAVLDDIAKLYQDLEWRVTIRETRMNFRGARGAGWVLELR
jgi:hypothetical protein